MKNISLKRFKILLPVLVIVLSIILTIGISTQAQASDPPLAELYFYNHGAVSGLTALDTTTYKSSTESEIDNAGYNCYSYTNVQAGPSSQSSIIRTLDDDAIFFMRSHSGKGRMVCIDNSNNYTRIAANSTSPSNNYSLEYNFENTTAKLRSMRLAYWWGCSTYGTDSTYGSLNDKSNTLGVDCNVTHDGEAYTTPGNYFTYCFAFYLDQGQNVATALSNAKNYTIQQLGNGSSVTQTVNNYKIRGANSNPGSVTIEPASFGTY